MEIKRQLMEVIEPVLERHGLELVDVELQREPRGQTLRVYVDREGGIDLDLLSVVSREISDPLDVSDLVPGRYTLELSSPGINRPLVKPEHFDRYRGRRVRVRRRQAVDGVRNVLGVLRDVTPEGITVRSETGDEVRIPFAGIDRANYEHEFTTSDFGSRSRGRRSRAGKR